MRLNQIHGVNPAPVRETPTTSEGARPGDFAEALTRAGATMAESQATAAQAVETFTRGAEGDLHDTLLAVDKAEISLKLLVNVRNRLVEAYREVMRMGM